MCEFDENGLGMGTVNKLFLIPDTGVPLSFFERKFMLSIFGYPAFNMVYSGIYTPVYHFLGGSWLVFVF